ncbi:uncharacterized protein VTP21DRAFT_4081 [Calcarisporiella thermophila]|uniref:uncharacterized protein n=1 Tax=Calcarisporiella thermophila TaxID=911321 RepID=UPI0037441E60
MDTNWCLCGRQIPYSTDTLYCSQECAQYDALSATLPDASLAFNRSPSPLSPTLSSHSTHTSTYITPILNSPPTSPSLTLPLLTLRSPHRLSPPPLSLGQAHQPSPPKAGAANYSMTTMNRSSLPGKRLFSF